MSRPRVSGWAGKLARANALMDASYSHDWREEMLCDVVYNRDYPAQAIREGFMLAGLFFSKCDANRAAASLALDGMPVTRVRGGER